MRLPLRVAGFIFALITLSHLLRWFLGVPLVVGTEVVGAWASLAAAVVFAALAVWMFVASFRK